MVKHGKTRGLAGTTSLTVGAEAVRLAIEEVGYENLNGRAVRDAMVTIKDFNTEIVPPITITDERPYLVGAGMRIH